MFYILTQNNTTISISTYLAPPSLWHLVPRRKGIASIMDVLLSPLQVNFLREGCGDDKICQSNLKLSYQFGNLKSDLFTPLPKLVPNPTWRGRGCRPNDARC